MRRPLKLALVFACAGLALGSERARAFSDPESYPLSVQEGGGGGRWFTGSATDGFGCDVCHDASGDLPLSISGWPGDGGYVAQQPYELTLSWPMAAEHVALVLEVVDDAGARAGSLQLPNFDATTPAERCTRENSEGMTGSALFEDERGREFATVIDCGTQALRMLWTAPAASAGRVWLSGGLVSADDDATVEGDVSIMIRSPSEVAGTAPRAIELTPSAGCQLTPLPPSRAPGSALMQLFMWALVVLCGRRAYGRLRAMTGGAR